MLVSEVIKAEIFLNNNLITTVEDGNTFGQKEELLLKNESLKEKRIKMIDGRVRQLEVVLTDRGKNITPICCYLREGNQRLTKERFEEIVELSIDFAWFISDKINPNSTEERPEKEKRPVEKAVRTQTFLKKVEKNKVAESSHSGTESAKIPTSNLVNENQTITKEVGRKQSAGDVHSKAQQQKLDMELIEALDKLVKLKQQGFLTAEEFNNAKTKLLKDLTEN